MGERNEWKIQINEELKSNGPSVQSEKEKWGKPSIYEIPSNITELNKEAYKPKTVSFGPFHNGDEKLKAMDEHKHRALIHFLKRCNKSIDLFFERMEQVVDELRDSYEPLDLIWLRDTPKFLQMMILDGCFMLEILRANDSVLDDYADNDPVFGNHGRVNVMPYISRDMLILENQLPMKVLLTLIEVETATIQGVNDMLIKQIVKFFDPEENLIKPEEIGSLGKCMHVLDVYRKVLIHQGPSHSTCAPNSEEWDGYESSITQLREAGIRFKISETQSLRDVSFCGGVLRLPLIFVEYDTEDTFLNLIAFERYHVGAGKHVTSYIFLMDCLIDTEADVEELFKSRIITVGLESNTAVTKVFNSLGKDISLRDHPDSRDLEVVRHSMSNYCKRPWRKWRANLVQNYFQNPWSGVSLFAAILLFVLTITQTVFTILQYYHC